MNVYQKQFNLNKWVLIIVVSFALILQQYAMSRNNSSTTVVDQLIILLSSTGFYSLLISFIYWATENSNFLLKIYWGKVYIKGLWSYHYVLNGKRCVGIWKIDQNLQGITVIGSGLYPNYSTRTIVRSVSPLIENQGAYFILNDRNELENNSHVYSKTTLILNQPKKPFSEVVSMRAITDIYGGLSNGQVHTNVIFIKHPDANSEDDVIEILKMQNQQIGEDNVFEILKIQNQQIDEEDKITNSLGTD
jgi:hypothetical protein